MKLFIAIACLLALPAPAQAAGCFDFTDAVGDTAIQPFGIEDDDPDLDVVGAEFVSTATTVGARVQVAQLGLTPAKAPSDVFQVGFSHAGFYLDIFAQRLPGNVVVGSSAPSGYTVTGTVDAANDSVTVSVLRSDVEAYAGGVSTTSARLDVLNVGTFANYGTWLLYDEAYAPNSVTYLVGSVCH